MWVVSHLRCAGSLPSSWGGLAGLRSLCLNHSGLSGMSTVPVRTSDGDGYLTTPSRIGTHEYASGRILLLCRQIAFQLGKHDKLTNPCSAPK